MSAPLVLHQVDNHHSGPAVAPGRFPLREVTMPPTPVNCTACGRPLKPHCLTSPTCRWMTCNTRSCEWRLYDLIIGRRVSNSGDVEQLGATPD